MTHRAMTISKVAPIYSDFARPFLERRFNPAVVAALFAALPTYSRGPRKGMLKGYVYWVKCERGGWYTTGPSYALGERTQGYVMRPGTHKVCVRLTNDLMSACLLTEEANATDDMRIAYFQNALKVGV